MRWREKVAAGSKGLKVEGGVEIEWVRFKRGSCSGGKLGGGRLKEEGGSPGLCRTVKTRTPQNNHSTG